MLLVNSVALIVSDWVFSLGFFSMIKSISWIKQSSFPWHFFRMVNWSRRSLSIWLCTLLRFCQSLNVYVHQCVTKGVSVYSLQLLLEWQIWQKKKSPEGCGKRPIQVVVLFHDVAAGFFILHFLAGIKSEPGSSGPASPVQGASSARASPVRSGSTVPSTPPPASAHTSGSSSTENSPNIDGERGDLIEFYNKVSKESKARILTCNNLR